LGIGWESCGASQMDVQTSLCHAKWGGLPQSLHGGVWLAEACDYEVIPYGIRVGS